MIKIYLKSQKSNTTCKVKEHLLGELSHSIWKHKYQDLFLLMLLKGENYRIEKLRINWKNIWRMLQKHLQACLWKNMPRKYLKLFAPNFFVQFLNAVLN